MEGEAAEREAEMRAARDEPFRCGHRDGPDFPAGGAGTRLGCIGDQAGRLCERRFRLWEPLRIFNSLDKSVMWNAWPHGRDGKEGTKFANGREESSGTGIVKYTCS